MSPPSTTRPAAPSAARAAIERPQSVFFRGGEGQRTEDPDSDGHKVDETAPAPGRDTRRASPGSAGHSSLVTADSTDDATVVYVSYVSSEASLHFTSLHFTSLHFRSCS